MEQMVNSDGIPAVPRNRNLSEFRSNPSTEEKTAIGIPFRATNIEANSRNSVPNRSAEEKTTRNPFRIEQNAAGYKKTGLGDLRRINYCMIVL